MEDHQNIQMKSQVFAFRFRYDHHHQIRNNEAVHTMNAMRPKEDSFLFFNSALILMMIKKCGMSSIFSF